jgi:hypothetical protein
MKLFQTDWVGQINPLSLLLPRYNLTGFFLSGLCKDLVFVQNLVVWLNPCTNKKLQLLHRALQMLESIGREMEYSVDILRDRPTNGSHIEKY